MDAALVVPAGAAVRFEPLRDVEARPELTESGDSLIGTLCTVCSAGFFPQRDLCFECGSDQVVPTNLGAEGILYSYSRVEISSSRPVPYTIGYVDLPSGVRVFADIEGAGLSPDLRVVLDVHSDRSWAFVPGQAPPVTADGAVAEHRA